MGDLLQLGRVQRGVKGPGGGLAELSPQLGGEETARLAGGVAAPVALTGATGFVGGHVLAALRRAGVARRVLVRDAGRLDGASDDEKIVVGSLEDEAALRELVRGSATVIHLAGVVRAGRAAEFQRANAAGTGRLLAAMVAGAPAARLVHVSSLAAAGPSAAPAGRAPQELPKPVSAYGRSKLAAEEAVRASGLAWVILRPPAIYGPGDKDVLQFFKLTAGGVVPLPAGERWVTVAYVADVVRAILVACRIGAGKVFHLGEPQPRRLDDLIATLAKSGDLPSPRILPLPGMVVRAAGLAGDLLQRLGARGVAMTSDKARELLARHWSAVTAPSLRALGVAGYVPFELGARATWAWYRRHGWVPRGTIRTE